MKSMIQLAALLGLSALCIRADFVVAPSDREIQAGSGSIFEGFATPDSEQLLYGSRNFSGPVLINGLAFRADETLGGSFNAVIQRFTLRLSTYSKPIANFSLSYNSNKGIDETLVFDSGLSWNGFDRTGGSPNPFELQISFSEPFIYSPANGHLLMQFVSSGDINESISVDVHGHNDPSIGLMTINGGISGGTIVTRFDVTQVPEPSPGALLICATAIILFFTRRRCP